MPRELFRGDRGGGPMDPIQKEKESLSDRITRDDLTGRTGRSRPAGLPLPRLASNLLCCRDSQQRHRRSAPGGAAMEIKVQCRKDDEGKWCIGDPGEVFVRERRVVWTFEGLEPGIVPLLVFEDNPPHGPFPKAWLTASPLVGELEEPPAVEAAHAYDILLIQ